jgi:SAM-dependent methyltransferase
VYSVDISSAVDADWENNKDNPRCHIVQADINALPFKPGIFDKAFCLGVLQHCPDPRQAFLSMVKHVKPGGSLAIDIYRSKPRDLVNPLNGMRLLTTRMDVASLYKMVTKYVPILFPVKQFIVDKWPLGRHIGFFIPVIYHKWIVPGGAALPQTTLLEWSILDTYDALAAKYDKPQTIKRIRGWCAEASLTSIEVEKGFNGINARGVVAETRRPQIP